MISKESDVEILRISFLCAHLNAFFRSAVHQYGDVRKITSFASFHNSYNGLFMIPEIVITAVVAAPVSAIKYIKKN